MPHHHPYTRSARALLLPALLAALLPLAACKREKPNATRDLRQNQDQLMDSMDKIAAELEAEQQAPPEPAEAPSPTTQPAPASDPPPTPPDDK